MKKRTPTAPAPRCELCRYWNGGDRFTWGDTEYARCANAPAYVDNFTGQAISGASRLTPSKESSCRGFYPAE